jgi:hypothetical protein
MCEFHAIARFSEITLNSFFQKPLLHCTDRALKELDIVHDDRNRPPASFQKSHRVADPAFGFDFPDRLSLDFETIQRTKISVAFVSPGSS